MLERASTCLESGGRRFFQAPKRCLRSRRMLHSSFWHHGASDLCLPVWWASTLIPDRLSGDIDGNESSTALSNNPRSHDGLILDFLYPEKTLALIQRMSGYGWDAIEARRAQQLKVGSIRQFSTTRRGQIHDKSNPFALNDASGELQEKLQHSTSADALRELLDSGVQDKEELAWQLFVSIPESDRAPRLCGDLLEYLGASNMSVDANRLVRIFDAIPTEKRRASSYRIAISAYLSRDMIPATTRLHEEAASRSLGLDFGTNLILGRMVRENRWDLVLRVFKTFYQCASRVDRRPIIWKRPPDDFRRLIWGEVLDLPDLRGHLVSLLRHFLQFQQVFQSSPEDEEVLKLFLNGFLPGVMDQVLLVKHPDENYIWGFFIGLFRDLKTLQLSTKYYYDYAMEKIFGLRRYRQYTNSWRKLLIDVYKLYKEEALQNPDPCFVPPKSLFKGLIKHVGDLGSTSGVAIYVKDWRTFYPDVPLPPTILRYLLDFYAEQGLAEKVEEYFNQYDPRAVNLRVISTLLYVFARRVDVESTSRQFKRISEEFGLAPDLACWNILLFAHTRADDLDGALAVFNNIIEAGFTPDKFTFGPLLDLCSARGDLEAYEVLWSRAEQLKVPLQSNANMRAKYVKACLNANDPEGAEAIAQQILQDKEAGIVKGSLTHTCNLMIAHYAVEGDIVSARRIYKQMVEHKIPLDSWTYAGLMRALIQVDQTNVAYNILRFTMPKNNMRVYAFHYAICMIGFLRENQFKKALKTRKRMLERGVQQTFDSRMASLQVLGVAQLQAMNESQTKYKKSKISYVRRRRRIVRVEQELRKILIEGTAADLAHDQPRHLSQIDSLGHGASQSYYGLLILLYGTNGAVNISKQLFKAALTTGLTGSDDRPSISLLTAIMEAHLRDKAYDKVAECWELVRSQAEQLVKTFEQARDPMSPKLEFNSLADSAVREAAAASKIAPSRRQILVRPVRVYIRSLLAQNDDRKLQEAQKTFFNLLTSGFELDNLTWNEFIQMLARRGRVLDAFTACEAYLIPQFPGWRDLNPFYIRRERKGFNWMDIRKGSITKGGLLPRYQTLVVLAAAYAQIKREEAAGSGYNQELGGWPTDVLGKVASNTVRAIETMPRTNDRLQQRFLR
ncbi:hypothetical protein CC78DRAFT_572346 [Lojkania enalia]|uniref:Uncharacterized protein n=1 Tax=Lojkania enalia TaxID=147567 RepID=A0A9P4JXE5_9PLEO|nr:hypothetical protein CC78DRAFT_572346 [Didymosphaeria enalia]